MQKRLLCGLVSLGVLALAACEEGVSPSPEASEAALLRTSTGANSALVAINQSLARRGAHFRVPYADYRTANGSGRVGQRLFAFDHGNKQLVVQWVPGDPRRDGRINITYLVDRSDGETHTVNQLGSAQTEAAIDRAMNTWDAVRCSKLSIDKVTDTGADPDLADGLLGFGGVGTTFADITHAGWYPAEFFDALVPGGSEFIVAATIPFAFTDGEGNFTDIDRDGNLDYAFAEIYYNDAFPWGIGQNAPFFDVEGTALHESGHGLGQAHFGSIFQTVANGKFHFAPFAVMNAVDPGFPTQVLQGTDIAGHCSIWASWPN